MKILNSILGFALLSTLSIGCKDTASKPTDENALATTKKEIAIAVKPEKVSFKIDGMVCPDGCAKMIEKKLAETQGVQEVNVDYEAKTATVNFDLDKISSQDLVKAVESAGDGKTYKVSDVKTGIKG
jgi:periplasmic mercuric ion binding protein